MIESLFKKGIYIVHAIRGYERHGDRVKKLMGKQGLNFEFVSNADPELFSDELLNKYFPSEFTNKHKKGTISCTLNHIYAYERIVKEQVPLAIVFEDDPFFLGEFKPKLLLLENEIKKLDPGFIISLENTTQRYPSFWDTKKGKHLYAAKTNRAAGAYILDLKTATILTDQIKRNKCDEVIDWWQFRQSEKGLIKMYWAHPAMVEQGSINGGLSAEISTRSSSSTRRLRWKIHKFYKMYFRRLFPEKRIIKE
tara:strand:+ start:2497 stop:3252 length:756 start_codon:yes stop_codon:yes gene_type:complete